MDEVVIVDLEEQPVSGAFNGSKVMLAIGIVAFSEAIEHLQPGHDPSYQFRAKFLDALGGDDHIAGAGLTPEQPIVQTADDPVPPVVPTRSLNLVAWFSPRVGYSRDHLRCSRRVKSPRIC